MAWIDWLVLHVSWSGVLCGACAGTMISVLFNRLAFMDGYRKGYEACRFHLARRAELTGFSQLGAELREGEYARGTLPFAGAEPAGVRYEPVYCVTCLKWDRGNKCNTRLSCPLRAAS